MCLLPEFPRSSDPEASLSGKLTTLQFGRFDIFIADYTWVLHYDYMGMLLYYMAPISWVQRVMDVCLPGSALELGLESLGSIVKSVTFS